MSEETNTDHNEQSNWDGNLENLSSVSENTRNFITNKGYKNIDSMTDSYRELESFVGQRDQMLRIPDEGDTEGWAKANIRLGMPEKAEDYKLNVPDDSPLKGETDLIASFKAYAHQGGMPQKGFDGVINFYQEAMKAGEVEYQRQMDEAQTVIRERFDTEDEYTDYTKKALGFAEKFRVNDNRSAADVIEDKGLAHDPEILEMFTKLADSIVEDALPHTETSVTQTRSEQILAITNNKAFTDALHPQHRKIMEEYKAIFAPHKTEG